MRAAADTYSAFLRPTQAVADWGVGYVVLTSVDRDDLPDGGAEHFAKTVRGVLSGMPGALSQPAAAAPCTCASSWGWHACRTLLRLTCVLCFGCVVQVRTLKALKPSILIECLTPDFRCAELHTAWCMRCCWWLYLCSTCCRGITVSGQHLGSAAADLPRQLAPRGAVLLLTTLASERTLAGATWRLCATWHAAGWTCLPTTWRRCVAGWGGANAGLMAALVQRSGSPATCFQGIGLHSTHRTGQGPCQPAHDRPAPAPTRRWSGCSGGCATHAPATSRAWTCCGRPRSAACTPSHRSCWGWVSANCLFWPCLLAGHAPVAGVAGSCLLACRLRYLMVTACAHVAISMCSCRHQHVRMSPSARPSAGETDDEIIDAMVDMKEAGVDILTFGQYLQPTPHHLPVAEYVTPEKFEHWCVSVSVEQCVGLVLRLVLHFQERPSTTSAE